MHLSSASWYRLFLLNLLALLWCAGPAAHAQTKAALPSIESFFENSAFGAAKLSPDAKSLAARVGAPGRRDYLAVIDLETNSARFVAGYNDADIGNFQWVNDNRLVFDVTDKEVGQGDVNYGPGLFAVNRDGTQLIQLADRHNAFVATASISRKLLPWHTFLLNQRGAQDSEFIYVSSYKYDDNRDLNHVDLLRLNTLSGRAQKIPYPALAKGWMLDHQGEPRIVWTSERDTATLFYREPASGQWRKLASHGAYTRRHDAIEPLAFGPDGTLYVEANGNKDTTSVHTFDLATGRISAEPLIVTTGYDFNGQLVTDHNKVLGVHYLTDAQSSVWFDPGMKAIQQTVDTLLPGTMNLISVAARAQAPWVLVKSYSDVIPPSYRLFNTKTQMLNKVGDSHPGIDSAQMGHQDALHYKARDGLQIPALLTLPAGSNRKNLPLVVLVHGGPWVRGASWGWNPPSQFLASRGYAVLEPSFRGSTGFGAAHFMAGWKQWGLAMQNDIADGARWAIAQGIADPRRICIAGASYGGYATLMGLVNDPDLFKCGINWVGVTDINLMYTGNWLFKSDMSEQWKQYGMPQLVGDQVKDAAQLKATSPLEQAARIRQPLLLAYGGADRRVPLYHGTKFREAVKATNPNVEWVVYEEEGHGWALPKNRIDFWTRVEKFLEKNIGKQ
jgi:dipeptidyl aminopeptidase/acylaminoacyl peptidase